MKLIRAQEVQNCAQLKNCEESFDKVKKVLICLVTVFVLFGLHIKRRNQLISLQLAIPQVEKQLRIVKRENARLQEEILRVEEPAILLQWLKEPEYGHLRHPTQDEVLTLEDPS